MARAPRLSYLMRQAQLANFQQLDEVVRAFGLTPSQYIVLSVVHEHREGGVSSAALARRLGITPQSSHEIIAGLERLGLIQRTEDTVFRRALKVTLTATGAALLRKCDRRVDRFEQQFYDGLTANEQAQLRAMLVTVIRHGRERIGSDSLGLAAAH
ncbi:MAG: MarR family winged helix-turn-helix transcriptional regulator [Stellaceae bacterium]